MDTHLIPGSQLGHSLPQTIAIVRSLPGLGDLLCVVPAVRALRAASPTARITLIGLPWAQGFVQRFSQYFNDWLEFPGCPGIPEVPLSPSRTVSFLAQVQRSPFDLALQMHGNGSYINSFTMLLGTRVTAGFFPSGYDCPDRDRFLLYPEHEPEIWRHLRLMEFLGIPLAGDELEFPLQQADWQSLQAALADRPLPPGRYICVHPGASVSDRRWSLEHLATVADALAARGFQIVLTGTAAEASLTQAVAEMMRCPVLDLAGKTNLGAIAALLQQAQLVICNDTGISHLAAAVKTKSVVIFSNSDPRRWAPLNRMRHRIVVSANLMHQVLPQDACLTGAPVATPEAVLAEAFDLLQEEVAYAS